MQILKERFELVSKYCEIHNNINQRPQLPYVLHLLNIGEKGNKNVYFGIIESCSGNIQGLQQKWSYNLYEEIRYETVATAFRNAKLFSPILYQHFNQYKLIHRRTINNKLLYKMRISETEKCLFR